MPLGYPENVEGGRSCIGFLARLILSFTFSRVLQSWMEICGVMARDEGEVIGLILFR